MAEVGSPSNSGDSQATNVGVIRPLKPKQETSVIKPLTPRQRDMGTPANQLLADRHAKLAPYDSEVRKGNVTSNDTLTPLPTEKTHVFESADTERIATENLAELDKKFVKAASDNPNQPGKLAPLRERD